MILLVLLGMAIIAIIKLIVIFIVESIREENYNSEMFKLRTSGRKIKYANQTTGTISYIDLDGNYKSISVYKGYNSHYRG